MVMLKIVLIVYLLFPLTGNSEKQSLPWKFRAKVIAVKDGDTVEVLCNGKPLAIRFAHIDCPEIKKGQPFARKAKQFTSAMCFGQVVTIENDNKFDRYQRLIGIVINAKGKNVNKELLKAGLAWHFKKYSTNQLYAALENEARANHIGLWKDENPVPPWQWRNH